MDLWRKDLLEGTHFDDLPYYQAMGFKSGLEIHQQLDTQKKLFCHCPVRLRNDAPDAVILRHMRPTLSEMGTYDGTALMEYKTRKQVIYHLYRDNVCTYEMDDTPPFPINQQALEYAAEIALMLNCKLVSEVHITRKQYLDGSIPTGFQRTAIIGVDGWVPYRDRKIRIQQLALEEDSCREILDKGHSITFRTDRLSTPLIEIVTLPDMRTPQETAEVDALLGRLLRASGRVRRGIGTVRQDVNVSVTGSDRIEVKGVPRTPDIKAITHYEALRQKALLELRDELAKRGVTADTFQSKDADVTRMLVHTKSERMRAVLKAGGRIHAVVLRGWGEMLRWKTQPGLTFASELSGRVRVIACLDELPNMAVLDGRGDGIPVEEEVRVRKSIGAQPADAVALAWGPEEDVATAVREILIRAKEATIGVPQETRQHLPDACRTDFERILPGPDRMYPDTDSPPVPLTRERMQSILEQRALRPWERDKNYRELGVPAALADKLTVHPHARLFERLVASCPISPKLLAVAIVEWETAIRRARRMAGMPRSTIGEQQLEAFYRSAAEKGTPRRALRMALERLYSEGPIPAPEPMTCTELQTLCSRVASDCKSIHRKSAELTLDFALGRVLERSSGRAEPQATRKMLAELMN